MAPTRTARKSAAKAAPEPEVEETDEAAGPEVRWTKYVEKDPTPKQELCAEWMSERTGYELDVKTVQIVLSMYGDFQRSPENKEFSEQSKVANAEKDAERRRAAEERKAAKATAPKRSRRSAADAEDDEGEAEEAPAPRRGRATAVAGKKAAPAARRSRRAKPAEGDEDFD